MGRVDKDYLVQAKLPHLRDQRWLHLEILMVFGKSNFKNDVAYIEKREEIHLQSLPILRNLLINRKVELVWIYAMPTSEKVK